MIVFLNGQFVPADEAKVSVFDRGFLYGDALFETIACHGGRPFLWDEHAARLAAGAAFLKLRLPVDEPALLDIVIELLRRNALAEAVLRISLSRGPGPRGYSIRGADTPTLVATAHPMPAVGEGPQPLQRLHTASVRLPPGDPLSAWKTAPKLLHILARTEAEAAGADEGLLLNTVGHVAEAASANVFWWETAGLCTPPVGAGALAGVTRGFVLKLAHGLGWSCRETSTGPAALRAATGVFLSVSSRGILEVGALDGASLGRDPRFERLREAYAEAVQQFRVGDRIYG